MSFNEIDDEVGDECDLEEYKELKKRPYLLCLTIL